MGLNDRFYELYKENSSKINKNLRFLLNKYDYNGDWEDLKQDTLLKADKYFYNFDESKSSFFTWFIMISKRLLIDYNKSLGKKMSFNSVSVDETGNDNDDMKNSFLDINIKQEDGLYKNISYKEIMDIIKIEESEFFDLFSDYINGYSFEELSDKYDINKNTVKSKVFRIINKYKKRLN